jgi:hypothetical protein
MREEIVLLPICTLQPVCKIRTLCDGRSNVSVMEASGHDASPHYHGERNLTQDPISVTDDESYAHRRSKGRDRTLSLTNNHSFIAVVWKPTGADCIASKASVGKMWRSHEDVATTTAVLYCEATVFVEVGYQSSL